MIENDTIDQGAIDGYKASLQKLNPFRASNTTETLRSREVNVVGITVPGPGTGDYNLPLQGRGLPPIDYEEPQLEIRYSDSPEVQYKLQAKEYAPGNVLPVDWPEASKAMKLPNEFLDFPLASRVTKLEEQVDSILDRLAKFSIRASHKI